MREILRRLFNEDDLRLFEPSPVYFRCRCSRERVRRMLQGLGEAETRPILAERGEVEVRCDFCNRAYVFDAVDVARLFNAGRIERRRRPGSLASMPVRREKARSPSGGRPTRQLSLQPVAIGAAVEVTKRLKPSM